MEKAELMDMMKQMPLELENIVQDYLWTYRTKKEEEPEDDDDDLYEGTLMTNKKIRLKVALENTYTYKTAVLEELKDRTRKRPQSLWINPDYQFLDNIYMIHFGYTIKGIMIYAYMKKKKKRILIDFFDV